MAGEAMRFMHVVYRRALVADRETGRRARLCHAWVKHVMERIDLMIRDALVSAMVGQALALGWNPGQFNAASRTMRSSKGRSSWSSCPTPSAWLTH
jgi:hypothetical protein